MASADISAFSVDGDYFGSCTQDGKLKIWDTATCLLKQEYTPNLHLSSPCTCMTWLSLSRTSSVTPKKKRKSKSSEDGNVEIVALGTLSGNILLYNTATGDAENQLSKGHSASVRCLSWNCSNTLFSCSDDGLIVEWNISEKSVSSKWKVGSEPVSSILVLPDGNSLLSASRNISWWNLRDKHLIRTFTGHSSDVTHLLFVPSTNLGGENYFVSVAKGDRYINAWTLNERDRSKTPVASFVMEDIAINLSVSCEVGEPTCLAAVTRSGVMHLYRHQLNGKCQKPLKPKVTVQIASDTGQNKESVLPVPIHGARMCDSNTVLIAHGNLIYMSFEKISPNCYEKTLCLVRQDPRKLGALKEESISKIIVPESEEKVQYVHSANAVKRSKKIQSEVPMEERLENLKLNQPDPNQTQPRGDSMAHLLIQGLHSKDKRILQNVLFRRDANIISNTVIRLPIQVVVPLVKELTALVQGKCHTSQIAAQWLKAVLTMHAGQLLANPEITETFSPLLGLVETRLSLLAPLSRLRGRLDLLVDQISSSSETSDAVRDPEESLLVYQDAESSDEGSNVEEAANNSDSDRWDELSDEELETEGSEIHDEAMDDAETSS